MSRVVIQWGPVAHVNHFVRSSESYHRFTTPPLDARVHLLHSVAPYASIPLIFRPWQVAMEYILATGWDQNCTGVIIKCAQENARAIFWWWNGCKSTKVHKQSEDLIKVSPLCTLHSTIGKGYMQDRGYMQGGTCKSISQWIATICIRARPIFSWCWLPYLIVDGKQP